MAEETDANEQKIYHFTVNLNPVRYAKRFGVEIPDDSADEGLTDEGEAIAEDATVDYGKRMAGTMAGQCAATLQQCKAKNPLTCRYHGAKVIAQDIEALLRRQGVKGQVTVELQNVTKQGRKELLSAQVEIVGTKKEAKLVTKAMQAFANLPGVDSVEDGDYAPGKRIYTGFDIDILDPQAQARWGAAQAAQQPTPTPQPTPKPAPAPQVTASAQQQAAQSTPKSTPQPTPPPQPAPQPTPPAQPTAPQPQPQPASNQPANQQATPANRLRPPVAPPDPGKWTGMDEKDMDFLEEVGMNMAYLAQRVNHNIAKGDPTQYGAGKNALPKFQAIDANRLKALAANDAQAAVIAKMYDDAKASEAAGWANQILGGGVAYDESKYNTADPRNSTGYDTWGFDRNKVSGYQQWKKDKDAFDNFLPPKKERDAFLATVKGADANDIKDAQDASDEMSDIEDSLHALDEYLDKEQDPQNKAAIAKTIGEVESGYFAAEKKYQKAKAKLQTWLNGQSHMQDTIDETIKASKARGETIPTLLSKNWQNRIDANHKEALDSLEKKFNLTAQEKSEADAKIKKNMRHFYEEACKGNLTIGTICPHDDFISMLDDDWPASCNADPGSRYAPITKNCFGHHSKMSRTEGSFVFCRTMAEKPADFDHWWDGGDCCIFVDPKKASMAIVSDLYDGALKYGENGHGPYSHPHTGGACPPLMTDANACMVGQHLKKDVVTKDLTNLHGSDLLESTGLDRGNETLVVGGIRKTQCMAVKFYGSVPQFTPSQKAQIKALGITVYDRYGNEVKV